MEREYCKIIKKIKNQKNNWDKKEQIINDNRFLGNSTNIILILLIAVVFFKHKVVDISVLISLSAFVVAAITFLYGRIRYREYFVIHKLENSIDIETFITDFQKKVASELVPKEDKLEIRDIQVFEHNGSTYLKIYYLAN